MSRNQRFTFLGIAAVIAVVAVILLAGGSSDDGDTGEQASSAQTPTPSATDTPAGSEQTATPTPKPKPQPPLLTGGSVKKLRYTEGDTVRFRVRNDAAEEVHVHGYDIKKDLEPGKVATVSFKATITGIFEIEFEQSAQQIAELRVDPK
jgi:FtsP/CotA-like multicopper oxidase with cupredoxin domain